MNSIVKAIQLATEADRVEFFSPLKPLGIEVKTFKELREAVEDLVAQKRELQEEVDGYRKTEEEQAKRAEALESLESAGLEESLVDAYIAVPEKDRAAWVKTQLAASAGPIGGTRGGVNLNEELQDKGRAEEDKDIKNLVGQFSDPIGVK